MSQDKIINHWGKWINSNIPVTGVLSNNEIAWEWVNDEMCLTCESIIAEIDSEFADNLESEEYYNELESVECDSSHTRLFGDWLQDENEKYYPDPNGEFAAIENEDTTQVVFSKYTRRGNPCSPCYPGQVEFSNNGDFLAYTLPDYLLRENDL